jgi:hypothetical protein
MELNVLVQIEDAYRDCCPAIDQSILVVRLRAHKTPDSTCMRNANMAMLLTGDVNRQRCSTSVAVFITIWQSFTAYVQTDSQILSFLKDFFLPE